MAKGKSNKKKKNDKKGQRTDEISADDKPKSTKSKVQPKKKKKKEPNRNVMIAGRHNPAYLHNGITTAKYSPLSFLPKFLFEQFRLYSNIFFLATALMQQIPGVSPTGRWTTVIPLVFILLMSAIKELYEDFKRHKEDWRVNRTEAEVLHRFSARVIKKQWRQIEVGDLVVVKQDNFFPADLVLLSTSEPGGLCYIETANLDGETNLKARSSLRITDEFCSRELKPKKGPKSAAPTSPMDSANAKKKLYLGGLCSSSLLTASISCDPPNKQLYEFCGKLKMDREVYPIGPDNVLLRGAKMRNTEWALGAVIYTGHETKLMMNYSGSQTPLKQSHIEMETNKQILALLFLLIVICVISASASVWWIADNRERHWYIVGMQSKNWLLSMLTFIILYNNLIPISLQVTLEFVRVIQAYFINCDLEMYDKESDTPAMARTSNLNDELGQIRYILSDKTGTLTRNIMDFKKCAISGHIYDEKRFFRLIEKIKNKEDDWEKVREFLVLLAVCHTVIPEPNKNKNGGGGRFTYTASSPDEAALVKGAQKIGFEFVQRTPMQVVIEAMGKTERYEVLTVLEFNSDRKRMSVVVRNPANQLKLYCKGADSIIAKRLTEQSLAEFATETEIALCAFATDGLRTLCVAYADLTEKQFKDWEKEYNRTLLGEPGPEREKKLSDLASDLESNLTLLGATAIEDQLQVGVPETIETLMRAGINIWMLTGDKQETAINIGYSCRLLKNVQLQESYHIVNEESPEKTGESLANGLLKIKQHPEDFTLIIDSKSLTFALTPELQTQFMEVSIKCRSVICCRTTPAQKAEIVNAVRNHTNMITLAIGDGANDVAMIRAANVGVGISGQEGLQAVYSSDYAIAQFRFLARLLLVHGSWSLSRICKCILYSFYKNIVLYVIEVWYATISAWSGQAGFERWSLSNYNLLFTAMPPMVLGLFDRICSPEMLLNNPELYRDQWDCFSIRLFWFWIGSAIWHSLVLFYLSYFALGHDALWGNGKSDGGGFCFANILCTFVVITVCLKAALESSCWNIMTHIGIWGSILLWFIYLVIYGRIWPNMPVGGVDMASMDFIIFSTVLFWLGMAIIPFVALLVDIVVKLISRTCFKSLADKIIELELAKEDREGPARSASIMSARTVQMVKGLLPVKATGATPKRTIGSPITNDAEIDAFHGYSFSQVEGNPDNRMNQANVIRMYHTKMK